MKSKKEKIKWIISCDDVKRELLKNTNFLKNKNIINAYFSCGTHPLVIVFEGSLQDRADLERQYPGLNLIGAKNSLILKQIKKGSFELDMNAFFKKMLCIIFLRLEIKKNEFMINRFISKIENKFKKKINIISCYETVSVDGSNHCMEIMTDSIDTLNEFLTMCQDNKIPTATKLVLEPYKFNGKVYIDEYKEHKKKYPTHTISPNYKFASIFHSEAANIFNPQNTRYPILDHQIRFVGTKIGKALTANDDEVKKNFLLFSPEDNQDNKKLQINDLYHPNKMIQRYSVKLERLGWLKILLFLKAKLGSKKQLQEGIQKNILGVKNNWFARKFYHITGEYDFIVPVDCKDIDSISEIHDELDKLKEGETQFVRKRYLVICNKGVSSDFSAELSSVEIAIINALLINSTGMYDFCNNLPTLFIRLVNVFNNMPQTEEQMVKEMGVLTPQEEYVCKQLFREYKKLSDGLIFLPPQKLKYLQTFNVSKIGIKPSVEFEDHEGLAKIIVRCRFIDDVKCQSFEKGVLKNWQNEHKIIVNDYSDIRDKLQRFYIWKGVNLHHLYELIQELQPHCFQFEFGIILRQDYYSKNLESSIRCQPCFYPIDRNECPNCIQSDCTTCVKNECSHCIRYVTPKKKSQLLEIDLDYGKNSNNIRAEDTLKIAAVGVDLTPHKYKIISKQNRPQEEYEKLIRNTLFSLLKKGRNIIIFPEFSIPRKIYENLSEQIINEKLLKKGIIVFGSHLENKYNCSPIMVALSDSDIKVWHNYKNSIAHGEEDFTKHEGKGFLKFLSRDFGNFLTLICKDAFDVDLSNYVNNCDLLFIPSWNYSENYTVWIKTVRDLGELSILSVYCNTKNTSESLKTQIQIKASRIKNKVIIMNPKKIYGYTVYISKLDISIQQLKDIYNPLINNKQP